MFHAYPQCDLSGGLEARKRDVFAGAQEISCASQRAKGGMGFRDMHIVNLAKLGKQGWRLMQEPESLVAPVLRANYHPGSSFLNAELRPRLSFFSGIVFGWCVKCFSLVFGIESVMDDNTTTTLPHCRIGFCL